MAHLVAVNQQEKPDESPELSGEQLVRERAPVDPVQHPHIAVVYILVAICVPTTVNQKPRFDTARRRLEGAASMKGATSWCGERPTGPVTVRMIPTTISALV